MTESPCQAAIALARAAQVDPTGRLTLRLLHDYQAEGLDPLQIAYVQAFFIAKADQSICAQEQQDAGGWLARMGGQAATAAATA